MAGPSTGCSLFTCPQTHAEEACALLVSPLFQAADVFLWSPSGAFESGVIVTKVRRDTSICMSGLIERLHFTNDHASTSSSCVESHKLAE